MCNIFRGCYYFDGTQNYTYNDNTDIAGKKDFEGNMTAVSYDTLTRTRKTSYADGTETVIVYDACGNILSAMNETGTVTYTYNKAGKLIKQTDTKTGTDINYTYDKAGRKSSLTSDKRKILYAYGKNGEILSVKDNVQNLAVSYTYDKCGRETERRFANGVVQKTRYDKASRAVSIAQYNRTGQLISGEAYVYDETGRRSHTVNEKGLVTIYKYDNQSRLQTVYYPYNEDIKETARKEADKQGLYFLPSQGNAENYFLSSSEMIKLRAAAENLSRARGNSITVNQVVWKESYTYDANSNRTSKTTAWGTVAYSYDKENRLVESGDLGKSESVKYIYDKNGNLLRESAARYSKDYTYNAQNRMSFSDVQDSVLNTRNFTEYEYDAFGRRIETRQYLGDYTRNLYDGFSFDIIGKSALQGSYPMALPEQKYRTPNRQSATSVNGSGISPSGRNERGTDIGTRYRYIDENPLVPIPEVGSSTSTSISTTKTRSRPNNEYVLYSYGEPVAMSADGATSYFGTDILGSVRSVTDKYGTEQADYSYDAFGSPYLGNLENDIGFGYCGKVYDNGTGLYDYGFRDYSPNNARFTTIDPIRDGVNWFAYVVNDPVNWCDPFGLSATDANQNDLNITFSSDVFKNPYIGFTQPNVNFNITKLNSNTVVGQNPGTHIQKIQEIMNNNSSGNSSNPYNFSNTSLSEKNNVLKEIIKEQKKADEDRINARLRDGKASMLPQEGPCLMRALMGIAETYAGKNLTEAQMNAAISNLRSSSPSGLNGWSVNNSIAVIREAMKQLGVDITNMAIEEARPSGQTYNKNQYERVKANATASIRCVTRADSPNSGEVGHYQEGDKNGNLVFDPISGSSDGGRVLVETRYFQITINNQ